MIDACTGRVLPRPLSITNQDAISQVKVPVGEYGQLTHWQVTEWNNWEAQEVPIPKHQRRSRAKGEVEGVPEVGKHEQSMRMHVGGRLARHTRATEGYCIGALDPSCRNILGYTGRSASRDAGHV